MGLSAMGSFDVQGNMFDQAILGLRAGPWVQGYLEGHRTPHHAFLPIEELVQAARRMQAEVGRR
eukprot:10246794-Prorocentrum_lima.AAC.1